ncbi:MAG: hypothetical protein MZV70_40895 [Desulfobacterales bacterium]|nr:hypothetical protein [Desulfobacterales bacterium]
MVDLAWRHLVERHGTPVCRLNGGPLRPRLRRDRLRQAGRARAGLRLRPGPGLPARRRRTARRDGGPRPIDNAQFFNRPGPARDPPADLAHPRRAGLRHRHAAAGRAGSRGILVQHVEAFGDYQLNEAWTWEHQALIKARPVSGDAPIAAALRGHPRPRSSPGRGRGPGCAPRCAEMRERMRAERQPARAGRLRPRSRTRAASSTSSSWSSTWSCATPSATRSSCSWTDNVRLIQTLIGSAVLNEIHGPRPQARLPDLPRGRPPAEPAGKARPRARGKVRPPAAAHPPASGRRSSRDRLRRSLPFQTKNYKNCIYQN